VLGACRPRARAPESGFGAHAAVVNGWVLPVGKEHVARSCVYCGRRRALNVARTLQLIGTRDMGEATVLKTTGVEGWLDVLLLQ
jgi:hypothetical protein